MYTGELVTPKRIFFSSMSNMTSLKTIKGEELYLYAP